MEREEFKQKAKQSIDDLFVTIENLEARMEKARADIKEKYKDELTALHNKMADLQAKYDNLENSVEGKWDEVKDAFSASADSFKDAFTKLGSIFRNNPKPE
jgi:chromosome segregation ATPase